MHDASDLKGNVTEGHMETNERLVDGEHEMRRELQPETGQR